MDSRIQEILYNLADAAAAAADGVSDVMHTAGTVVGEKYDVLKLNVEINRLQTEQDKLFASIGHTMYTLQTGGARPSEDEQAKQQADAQETVDHLLLLADQKQQEIDAACRRLAAISGTAPCPSCGKQGREDEAFCSGCGQKLKG